MLIKPGLRCFHTFVGLAQLETTPDLARIICCDLYIFLSVGERVKNLKNSSNAVNESNQLRLELDVKNRSICYCQLFSIPSLSEAALPKKPKAKLDSFL